MLRYIGLALSAAVPLIASAAAQSVSRVYTQFDTQRCRHFPGSAPEDYGFWLCAGYRDIGIRVSGGDQRMSVSFGRNAGQEPAAKQTFAAFNNIYKGTVEWRIETPSGGKPRPFAAILRWNVRLESDERDSTGRVLVVTRLGPGGVCHVGYVDGRANPDANAIAVRLADDKSRSFRCGQDTPIVLGKVMPGLNMPKGE